MKEASPILVEGLSKLEYRGYDSAGVAVIDNGQIEVLKIDSDELGGFNVTLSGGYKLEVFPDSSEDDEQSEHWRFFNRKENNPHFIVTGSGIEKV